MCFSALASFSAGAFLVAAGTLSVRLAQDRRELPFAAIPLLFAAQQLTEGVLWLAFDWNAVVLQQVATQVYSFFSHVLWPIYVPAAAWMLEPPGSRRRALMGVWAAGTAVGLYLLYSMFAYPITAVPVGGHIDYQSPHFYAAASMLLYLTATTASLLLTSHWRVRLFGGLAFVAFIFAYLAYTRWFISVWCFFAALLSVVICVHLRAERRPLGGSAPAGAGAGI